MARKSSMERALKIAGGFATSKKNIVIQYRGRERNEDALMSQIQQDAMAKGLKDEEIECVDVYIKPEESTVFYVINKEIEGSIAF